MKSSIVWRMGWTTILGTLAGAVIGIAATGIADYQRWRQERGRDLASVRREKYVEYLTAIAGAVEDLRLASLTAHVDDTARVEAFRRAFRGANLLELRFTITMMAPSNIAEIATDSYRMTREVRNALIGGAQVGTPDYKRALDRCYISSRKMAGLMREDLGVPPLDFIPFGTDGD